MPVIELFGDVGGESLAMLSYALQATPPGEDIELRICSDGGSVFEGLAMYHALKEHPSKVITKNYGLAASMASILFLAGDERIMMPGSMLMLHSPWGPSGMDQELLSKMRNALAGIYSSATGKTVASSDKLLNGETWLDAAESLEMGFATAAPKGEAAYKALAKLRDSQIKGAPRALVALVAKAREGERVNVKMDLRQLNLILGLPETASLEEIAQAIEALKGVTTAETLDAASEGLNAKVQAEIESLKLKAKANERAEYEAVFAKHPEVFTVALQAKASKWPLDVVKEFAEGQAKLAAAAARPAATEPVRDVTVPVAGEKNEAALKAYAKASGKSVAEIKEIWAKRESLKFPVRFVSELGDSK